MKVAGFTFIRNAIKYDYPIVEAIQSIAPLCDTIVVAVGNSDDDTLSLIQNIDPQKIKVIQTTWDDSLREGGRVLALETDKAYAALPEDIDWAFYIQGDEVMHEQYLPTVKKAMEKWKDNTKVDGLLFNYRHFYGSYDYIGEASHWYRKEIRIIRKREDIYSYRDAQGFRKGNNQKLNVKPIDAYINHYGWVKDPRAMQGKQESFHKYWHDDNWMEENVAKAEAFDYSDIDALAKFNGTHPKVMQERIGKINWKFDFDISKNTFTPKERFKRVVKKLTGFQIGEHKNYKIK